MGDGTNSLSPPKKGHTEDPGAHELDSSEDDHFSDAHSAPSESPRNSPIPRTRVEKVSDEPSYGEVPGTDAYRKREGDAEPDEIAIIPEKVSKPPAEDDVTSPPPRSESIPKTVVEETEDTAGSETHPERKHRSDPPPDLVLKAAERTSGDASTDSPISPALKTPQTARSRKSPQPFSPDPRSADLDSVDDADDFADDFDDFEEGAEVDDDFGEFDDGFQEPSAASSPLPQRPPPFQPLSFPIPDFEGLDADEILSTSEPYLNAIFPPDDDIPTLPPLSKDHPVFLSQRSASLWSQLVAPPPLQPPDWIRSRIRRLFLVSLGVPVDLDEILPASKQKKLVLPSLGGNGDYSPRTSTDSRRDNLSRLRERDGNASTTSLDSQGKARKSSSRPGAPRWRKGPQPAPDLDLVTAKQLCTTTDEALDGMTDAELQAHVAELEAMEGAAAELLEFWKKRTDEKIGDREAFEGVIENLVKHARKTRK